MRTPGLEARVRRHTSRTGRNQRNKVLSDDVLHCRKSLVGEDSQSVRTKTRSGTGDFAENGFASRLQIKCVPAFESQLGYPDDRSKFRIAWLPEIHVAQSESLKHREPALVADLGPALAEPKVLIDRRKLLDHLNDLGDLIGTELDRRQLFQTSHIRLLRGSESLTAFGRESLR